MSNENKLRDMQYVSIVEDILDNKEFGKTKEIVHHGLDRMGHSLRAYKISKILGLDYKSAARAGLLHDFFLQNNQESNLKERAQTLVKHPQYAVENASKEFRLNELEKDIITTHMFPIAPKIPRYLESWVVNLVDDAVAIAEVGYSARNKVTYALNFILIFVFANLR